MSVKVAIIGSDQVIGDIREVLDEDKSRQYLFCNPLASSCNRRDDPD